MSFIHGSSAVNATAPRFHRLSSRKIATALRPCTARAQHAERVPVTGDSLRGEIRWKNQPDLSALKGKNIRIKISGRNLIAYSASFER